MILRHAFVLVALTLLRSLDIGAQQQQEQPEQYLLFGLNGGVGNQLKGLANGINCAEALNRTLILPPLFGHTNLHSVRFSNSQEYPWGGHAGCNTHQNDDYEKRLWPMLEKGQKFDPHEHGKWDWDLVFDLSPVKRFVRMVHFVDWRARYIEEENHGVDSFNASHFHIGPACGTEKDIALLRDLVFPPSTPTLTWGNMMYFEDGGPASYLPGRQAFMADVKFSPGILDLVGRITRQWASSTTTPAGERNIVGNGSTEEMPFSSLVSVHIRAGDMAKMSTHETTVQRLLALLERDMKKGVLKGGGGQEAGAQTPITSPPDALFVWVGMDFTRDSPELVDVVYKSPLCALPSSSSSSSSSTTPRRCASSADPWVETLIAESDVHPVIAAAFLDMAFYTLSDGGFFSRSYAGHISTYDYFPKWQRRGRSPSWPKSDKDM